MSGETFGQMLKRLRFELGMSQNRLSQAVKIDPAYINRMERSGQKTVSGQVIGDVNPSRHVALSLAEALGLDAATTDRLLFKAGLAPQVDWQARAANLERRLATIREAFDDVAGVESEPTFIRRQVG